jgi:hypothetical protein
MKMLTKLQAKMMNFQGIIPLNYASTAALLVASFCAMLQALKIMLSSKLGM